MIIRNIDIWNPDAVLKSKDLYLEGHRIEKIEDSKEKTEARFTLIPSGVDAQVHLRIPGQEHKENAKTGLMAALCGGYGAVLSMPNTQPVIDTPELVQEFYERTKTVSDQLGIKVMASAAATKAQKGEAVVDFKNLAAAGIQAFTDDGLGVVEDERMEEVFSNLEKLDLPFLQHAEFPGHGGVLAPSSVQTKLGVSPYDESHEIRMLERDLKLLKKYPKARYHLLHATSAKALPLIKEAKSNGLRVTAEVSPHHLFFCSEDIDPNNSSFKMNPPLRSKADQEALQQALFGGEFDFVATDHAPHAENEKAEDFSEASFGTLGLETALPVLLDFYQSGELTAERLVKIFSTRPAQFLGIDHEFGKIEEGRVLRAVILRPQAEKKKLRAEALHSQSKNSCFDGVLLPSAIIGHYTSSGYFAFQEGFCGED